MTENTPNNEHDDTQRLPNDDRSHRYTGPGGASHQEHGQPQQGSPYSFSAPSYPSQQGGFGFDSSPSTEQRRRIRPSNGFIAGVLVAALVVGGLSGLAGAAGFTLVDDLAGGGATTSSSAGVTNSPVVSQKNAPVASDSAEAVAKKVLPSVVKINVSGPQGSGSGSGIIISSDGQILTNNHVAALAGKHGSMSVNFNDGSAKPATVVGTDPITDLAVIKAQGVSGLHPATIDKSNNLQVGQSVVAIGSPFGLQATVTSGIVSALNRPVSVGSQSSGNMDTTYPAIQTDAAINPGNSGGPLVNSNGEVIGIDSSIRTASDALSGGQGGSIGLGFAIPISKVWPVVTQLRNGQTATHARLGITVTDASSNHGLLTGAGVESVMNGSPARSAGLQKGDVITKVNRDVITGSESLVATIRGYRPGDTVTLTVVHGSSTRKVQVTLESDAGAATS
jgi:putative serine protease PepD